MDFSEEIIAHNNAEARTFMAKVARDRAIPYGSELYLAGLAQFSANIAATIDGYERAGIPVFLATIGSNLSGQPPFSSAPLSIPLALDQYRLARDNDLLRFRAPTQINAIVEELTRNSFAEFVDANASLEAVAPIF